MRVLLVDQDVKLVRAWQEVFRDIEEVEASAGDYFEQAADALVSPANSFGIMDGGLDLAIRDTLGLEVERRVQATIAERHHGELAIGAAEIVATSHSRWPWLICARHSSPINSLVCSGLGTGEGRMPPRRCAAQMRQAWLQVNFDPELPSFQRIHTVHQSMKTVD
jgi:O-acetyl-ADP-ribose deacetylase (regulator of RNase III)